MQCQAKSKRTGEQCGNYAMHGQRVCRMHGGKSLSGTASPSFIHGRYSKALADHPEVLAAYEEAKADPNLTETLNEIALLRAKLQGYLKNYGGMDHPDVLKAVGDYADSM